MRDLINVGNAHYAKLGPAKANAAQLKAMATFVCDTLQMFGAADADADIDLTRYSDADHGRIATDVIAVARRFLAAIDAAADEDNRAMATELIGAFVERCRDSFGVDLGSGAGAATVSMETCDRATLDGLLDALAQLRQTIRVVSIGNKWRRFLAECDALRDGALAAIGVRLQDSPGDTAAPAAIGLMPKEILLLALAAAATPVAKATKKQQQPISNDAPVHPQEMFRHGKYQGKYSLYDDAGLPTHDAAGNELSKNLRAKLDKLQRKSHDDFAGGKR